MFEFLANSNVISDTQFGVLRKFTITLAVFHLVADLLKLSHNKTYRIYLFLDIRKAFDTVNVEFFVEKLKMYGIRDTASLLKNNYLSNRDQYVDYKQDVLPVNVGVPQGSVLGYAPPV